MLISFSVTNYLSFKDTTTFSMVARKEHHRKDRLPRTNKYKLNILPTAAIYGGNAAGKSNFAEALFATHAMMAENFDPGDPIPAWPFLLDTESINSPSKFAFELLIKETIYEYSYSITQSEVVEEKLTKILKTTEKVLFHRIGNKITATQKGKDPGLFDLVFKSTRGNQLFLSNSVRMNLLLYMDIYEWFINSIVFIKPNMQYANYSNFIADDNPTGIAYQNILSRLDTGISRISAEEISLESLLLDDEVLTRIKKLVSLHGSRTITLKQGRYIFSLDRGELKVQRLITYHQSSDGFEVPFRQALESDGTKRVMDLLPAFLDIAAGPSKLYIIDEIDRSLHTLLVRQLLESYLESCGPDTRSQLIFTTHDVMLMDQNLLRRDEMWVAERSTLGCSKLFAISDYRGVRADTDIKKSYLMGRFGGIPQVLLSGPLQHDNDEH